jgi:hypothetical protein
MKISCVLNVHGNTETVLDTLDAIKRWVTDDILVIVDGSKWEWGEQLVIPAHKMRGFVQHTSRSPYRNVALGIQQAWGMWPDSDWLCYVEYDTLFTSDRFRQNLELADKQNVWMLGNDGRFEHFTVPWLESLTGKMQNGYYLLGCCQFFSKQFLQKLEETGFLEKFLHLSNGFSNHVPGYSGYDISEYMYPTLARYWGGNVGVFASWDGQKWHGAHGYFPMRWKPEIEDDFPQASIIHPLKSYNHPIRVLHREKRRVNGKN